MSTKTARQDIVNFLHTRLSPEVMMEFNSYIFERPDLSKWLDVPESRRHAILEAEGADAARHRMNLGGAPR